MQISKLERWLPLTGLVFVATMVVTLVLPESPNTTAGPVKVAAYYTDNKDMAMALSLAIGVAGVMFALFAGSLRNLLAKSEDGGLMSSIVLGGGVLLGGGMMLFASAIFATAETIGKVSISETRVLHILSNDLFMPFLGGWALFGISAGAAIIRSRALPVWLGWVALVFGIIGMTPMGWFTFLLGLVWVAVVAVLMIVRAGAPEGAGGETAAEKLMETVT